MAIHNLTNTTGSTFIKKVSNGILKIVTYRRQLVSIHCLLTLYGNGKEAHLVFRNSVDMQYGTDRTKQIYRGRC